jgi:hypothetical protein
VSQPFLIRLAHPTLPENDLALDARLARSWAWPQQRVLTIVADAEA